MIEDWIECRIDQAFKTVTGNTPSKKEGGNYGSSLPFVKPPQINNGIIDEASEFLSDKGKLKARILPPNSVLVTCIGNLGRVGINKFEVAFNQQINALIPADHSMPKFIFYQCQSIKFRNQLEKLSTSTTVALVNKGSFNSVNVVLPPLPIQRAIVSKIESLFSSLDSGIADLKKAQEQLKIYRQAVLKKAFEGELTKEWREQQALKIGEWKETELSSVCKHITDGDHQAPPKSESGIPFITISNINKRTRQINFENTFYVKTEYFDNLNTKRVPVMGDILYTVTGSFGIPVLINFSKDFCFQRHIGLLRPNKELVNQIWLYYVLQSQSVYKQAFIKATGTAQKTVSLKTLRGITIKTCSIDEQKQIVKQIESRLSVCDKVEKDIKDSLEKSQALRQSILKKAFEGKLLTATEIDRCKQEADYEPASVLLERIRKEKAI